MGLTAPREKPEESAVCSDVGTSVGTQDCSGPGTGHRRVLFKELPRDSTDWWFGLVCFGVFCDYWTTRMLLLCILANPLLGSETTIVVELLVISRIVPRPFPVAVWRANSTDPGKESDWGRLALSRAKFAAASVPASKHGFNKGRKGSRSEGQGVLFLAPASRALPWKELLWDPSKPAFIM